MLNKKHRRIAKLRRLKNQRISLKSRIVYKLHYDKYSNILSEVVKLIRNDRLITRFENKCRKLSKI